MRFYAARAGGYWFDGDNWVEGFDNALVCGSARLKTRLTNSNDAYWSNGANTNDPFKAALLAAGGEIVSFELKEVPGESIPINAEVTGPDSKGNFIIKMIYEKKKKGKK